MKKLLLLTAAITLSACATTSGGALGNRVDWRCDGGAAFSLRYTPERAEVFAGGQVYRLPAVQAASGERFSNGAVEYWEHGGEAMLNGAAGGPYTNCRR